MISAGPSFSLILAAMAALALAIPAGAAPDAAAAPSVGAPAPDFSLTSNEGKATGLKDFRGQWVVLYFYPKDFTSGCTLEAHNFQRDLPKYEASKAVILGVSVDDAKSHQDFCTKEGLSFKLLADPGAQVSTQYASVMEYNGNRMSARNTFLIDPEGKVAKVFLGVKPDSHSTDVLAALAELQHQHHPS
jgi:peroxiredoxin Q/BCP